MPSSVLLVPRPCLTIPLLKPSPLPAVPGHTLQPSSPRCRCLSWRGCTPADAAKQVLGRQCFPLEQGAGMPPSWWEALVADPEPSCPSHQPWALQPLPHCWPWNKNKGGLGSWAPAAQPHPVPAHLKTSHWIHTRWCVICSCNDHHDEILLICCFCSGFEITAGCLYKGVCSYRRHKRCFSLLMLFGSASANDNHSNQCILDSKLFPFLLQIMSGMHNVLI